MIEILKLFGIDKPISSGKKIARVLAIMAIVWPIFASADEVFQAPGLRCGTAVGWCWATVPGVPGAPCTCPGPDGQPVAGNLF